MYKVYNELLKHRYTHSLCSYHAGICVIDHLRGRWFDRYQFDSSDALFQGS
jgi:hypothetical protein